MTSYQGPYAWMLNPALQQNGMIAPQTAARVGGMPPQPGYPPDIQALRDRLIPQQMQGQGVTAPVGPRGVPQAAPQPPMRFYGPDAVKPKEKPKSLLQHIVGPKMPSPEAELRSGTAVQEQAAAAGAEAKANEAQEIGTAQGEAFAQAEKLGQTRLAIMKEAKMARSEAETTLRYAQEDQRRQDMHPGMGLDQILQNEQIVANKEGKYTPEQVKVAQAAMKKAQEIDPERIYGGSTGRKIMAAIGMALGAYGAALTKTPNYALQIVQKAIDEDIAAQREAFARRREAAKGAREEVAEAGRLKMAGFGDDLSEVSALEVINYDRAARLIEQTATKYATPQAKAAAAQMIGQLRTAEAEKREEFAHRKEALAIQRADLQLRRDALAQKGPGKTSKAGVGAAVAEKTINELLQLRAEGYAMPLSDRRARMKTLAQSLKFNIGAMHGTGALQEHEEKIIEEAMGNPTGLMEWNTEKLKTLLDIAHRFQESGIEHQDNRERDDGVVLEPHE